MDQELMEAINKWVNLSGDINLKNPPHFVMEILKRRKESVKNLEVKLDLLVSLGKFEKLSSGVYIPCSCEKKQAGFFGLLK
ncbi:hypothetical protein [Methanococcus sp. CF]